MAAYTWPAAWMPRRFRMFIAPNERSFSGYYSGQTQALDLLGESWRMELELAEMTGLVGQQVQAFLDRLRGRVNTITIGNIQRPVPVGTMRGTPTLLASAAQLASTIQIATTAGATLLAGDCIGFGGQLSRVMTDATADGTGHMTVEILPRVRIAQTAGASVLWDHPTANMILAAGGGSPVDFTPGSLDMGGALAGSVVLQLVEA